MQAVGHNGLQFTPSFRNCTRLPLPLWVESLWYCRQQKWVHWMLL